MTDEIGNIIEDGISEADAELLVGLADEVAETEYQMEEAEDAEVEETSADPAEEYLTRIAELEELLRSAESERLARERELLCLSLLGEAGLPVELAPAVQAAEDMEGTVELICKAVQSCVDNEMSKRCRSDTPLTGSKAPLTREELIRMPVAELQRLRNMSGSPDSRSSALL